MLVPDGVLDDVRAVTAKITFLCALPLRLEGGAVQPGDTIEQAKPLLKNLWRSLRCYAIGTAHSTGSRPSTA
jgi:hypothetical protein